MPGVRHSQHREVYPRFRTLDGSRKRPPVRQDDLKRTPAANDMLVGENASGRIENDAGTLAARGLALRPLTATAFGRLLRAGGFNAHHGGSNALCGARNSV